MGSYDVRVDGPTLGGCTKEAYLGGGIRNYIGKRDGPNRELPAYLIPEAEKTPAQIKNEYIERPLEEKLAGMPSYLSQPIRKGPPMVGSCRGTCRTEQGCTCR